MDPSLEARDRSWDQEPYRRTGPPQIVPIPEISQEGNLSSLGFSSSKAGREPRRSSLQDKTILSVRNICLPLHYRTMLPFGHLDHLPWDACRPLDFIRVVVSEQFLPRDLAKKSSSSIFTGKGNVTRRTSVPLTEPVTNGVTPILKRIAYTDGVKASGNTFSLWFMRQEEDSQ